MRNSIAVPLRQDRWTPPLLLTLAAGALGYALQISNGTLWANSIEWLLVAVVASVLALALPTPKWLERHGETILVCALLVLAAINVRLLLAPNAPPGKFLRLTHGISLEQFRWLVRAAAFAIFLLTFDKLRSFATPAVILLYVLCGLWMVEATPNPLIDVVEFQREASKALLAGQNPYAMTFRDIYGSSPFYGEGLSVDGRLQFGFPYPPLSLLLILPGHLLGDYRFAHVAATAGAAALMAYSVRGRVAALAAAVFLFTPRAFFIIEEGWTEPLTVLIFSALVFFACRRPRFVPWLFGLLVAAKQYLLFATPLLLLIAPKRDAKLIWNWAWKAALIALVVSLPLVLWDLPAFVHSAVTLQFKQPFRTDAMSFLAWHFHEYGGTHPTGLWAFLLLAPSLALGLWRAPRTPAGFAGSVALLFLVFFAFNKQAFANYYFFVLGAFSCAIAAHGASPTPAEKSVTGGAT